MSIKEIVRLHGKLKDIASERVNQILEDTLKACVLDAREKWEDYLPYVEFSYDNGYSLTIKMALLKALHRRKCITSLLE